MKAGKVWPQRVIRRATFAIPFCMLFNALAALIMLAYGNGLLDKWFKSESLQELNSAILISFIFITHNFLSFFYQLCLGAVKSLGRSFRSAFVIGWFFVILRIISILLYGYLFAVLSEMAVEDYVVFYNLIDISDQIEYMMNILDGAIIFLLLHGFENMLSGETDKMIRGIMRVFRWTIALWVIYTAAVLLSSMPFMKDIVWLQQIVKPYIDDIILADVIPDIAAFIVLLAGVIYLRKKESASDTAVPGRTM